MFTTAMIQKMKQNNISVDGEKTKKHLAQVWKAASKREQETILELAGVARSTVHRAYRTGGVSAKLAAAAAQTLNIDPFYLTGASDLPGICSGEQMASFLQAHDYTALHAEWSKLERRQRNTASAAAASVPTAAGSAAPSAAVLDAVTEDDLIILMRSLLIKAKADDRSAQQLLTLKQLLLS